MVLACGVIVDHSIRERLCVCSEGGEQLEQRPAESAVDLSQRLFPGKVHIEERCVSEKSRGQDCAASVSGRITCGDELNSLKLHPGES